MLGEQSSESSVANDFLVACRGWQEVVNAQSTMEAKDEAGDYARQSLSQDHRFHGASKVIVKAETALMMPDGTSGEEAIWTVLQFDELRVVGDLGRLQYFRFNKEGTLAWMIQNARAIGISQEVELGAENNESLELDYYLPSKAPVRRAMYFPVSLIDYALCAN